MNNKLVGITAKVTMNRTLYIEVPENTTEEEILKRAKKEIILPHNALILANTLLNKAGIRYNGLDLNDWEIEESNFKIC